MRWRRSSRCTADPSLLTGPSTLSGAGSVVGAISAAVFIWVLLASGTAWIMGAGRAQAAACLDGAGPRVLGRISARTGVPVVMGLVSGGVSLVDDGSSTSGVTGGDAQQYFSAALTVAIAMIVLAYLLIFPAFVALRIRQPDLERPFRVPGRAGRRLVVSIVARRGQRWPRSACCGPVRHGAIPTRATGRLRRRARTVRAAGALARRDPAAGGLRVDVYGKRARARRLSAATDPDIVRRRPC